MTRSSKPTLDKLPASSVIPNVHDGTSLGVAADQAKLTAATRAAIADAGYDLGKLLGGGAYGRVFAATEQANNRRVAIKVVVDASNDNALRAFHREVKLLASEHVPRDVMPVLLTSHEQPGTQPFHVMELIPGREIHQHARTPRPLKLLEKCELIERMLHAVQRMHESNLIHGDIKPSNVLATGDRIYFVDFGHACRREEVYASLNSVVGPRGTPGFQTEELAAGERRPEASDDVWSAAAVAFYILTEKDVDKFRAAKSNGHAASSYDFRAIDAELTRHGVPRGMRRILLKGLRQKDSRKKVDPAVYPSADAMARDLADWRESRSRMRRMALHLVATAALVLVVAAVGFRGWTLYWEAEEGRDLQRLTELQSEVAVLPNKPEEAVSRQLDQAQQAAQERHQALADNDSAAARDALQKELQAYRQAIDTARGIERSRPLRRALGEALNRTPWVESSTVIREAKQQLDQQYHEIGERIDAGDTDAAWEQLGKFHEQLARLAEDNVLAAEAERAERQFAQLQDGVTERLRSQDGYQQIASLATDAAAAWKQGDWKQAQDLFGVAHAKLEEWLEANETTAERASRLAAQTEARLARESELATQIQRLAGERDQLDARVEELTEQIAKVNGQWLQDRDSARSRFTQLNDELTKAKSQQQALQQRLDALSESKQRVDQELADSAAQVADWQAKAEAARQDADNWKQALAAASTATTGGTVDAAIDPAEAQTSDRYTNVRQAPYSHNQGNLARMVRLRNGCTVSRTGIAASPVGTDGSQGGSAAARVI